MSSKRKHEEAPKRAMTLKPGGPELDMSYLTRKKHNPGIKKKRREFFKNAQLHRKYKTLLRREGFDEAQEAREGFDEAPKKKRVKLAPFGKEYERATKAREAREEKEGREKKAAGEARQRKRHMATARTKRGQPVMRLQVQAMLDKIKET